MNVTLHIDRLILDGVSIPHAQRPLLQAAIEAELGRLITTNGIAPNWLAGGAVPTVPAGNIQLTADHHPTEMGQQIAQAVYRGLGS
ncbi:hypothetical protein IQ268_20120 [Oculatella sp. LEGE 06141]|uniref:hypothetical protein n=1 Tax=Oculatella sp. LEGE 06141 TaxID=1828648 RepID=UPI0018805EB5|nr:hypothetical protein [Oculatella sp. LEGE 06141]MBE9180869.1 hypothetical protein [Oculatella sp. LEGE 06141]